MKQSIILALLSHVACVDRFKSASPQQYEVYGSYPQDKQEKLPTLKKQQPHKLSSKSGADPNAPGADKASGDEEAKVAVAPKVYEDKLWKENDQAGVNYNSGNSKDQTAIGEQHCASWQDMKDNLVCLGKGSMCHPGNDHWKNTTANHFFYNPYTQTNKNHQNCFVVQNEYSQYYDDYKTTKEFGAENFNMYGKSTNPGAVDPEKEKDFYPVKTLTVYTTKWVTNHGRWICDIKLTFWDSAVQERYSDPGFEKQHQDYGCGEELGGITNSYEFERGEQLMEMSAFSNGFGTEPKHFYQSYFAWNAISKLQFKTSKNVMWDSTKEQSYSHTSNIGGHEFKFDVAQRFLMGMTGGFRNYVEQFVGSEHKGPYKSTPLYSLGPLVSEKVIGREITNFRERRLDQTPSDGASVVNRTLCNDDWNVNAKPKAIDVTYELSVSEEAVNEVTERKYKEDEFEKSLTTTITAGYQAPIAEDPLGIMQTIKGTGLSVAFRATGYFVGKDHNEDETTKSQSDTTSKSRTHTVSYSLEARPRTSVTIMIERGDKQIISPYICDVMLMFDNGAQLFRGNIEGVQKENKLQTSNIFYHTRKLGNYESCDLRAELKEDESSTVQLLNQK